MKERWPEMLEYQQKVQAMQADIDRLLESLRLAEEEIDEWRGKLAEQCGKTLGAAAEMRERAKAACHERSQWAASKITNENADAMWATYSNACDDCLYFIAALPLTPQEPA